MARNTWTSIYTYSESDNPQVLEAEILTFEGSDGHYHVSDDEVELEQAEVVGSDSPCSSSNSNDPPLYNGAPVTLSTSKVMIMQYKIRHNLTDEGLADLLQLLRLHCPTPSHCVPSVYHFKKQFQNMKLPIKFHYFCSSCLQSVDDADTCCKNLLCMSDFKDVGARSSFIEVPIELQLQIQ